MALEIEARVLIRQQDRAELWMGAALQRVKKLPSIEAFTGVKTPKRKQTWQEMQAFMRSHLTPHEPAKR